MTLSKTEQFGGMMTMIENLDVREALELRESLEAPEAEAGAEAKPAALQTPEMTASALPLTWAKTDRNLAVSAPVRRIGQKIDWYSLAVVLLMLASGAVCVYRLLWAIQP